MSEANREEFRKLVEKYLSGNISQDERNALESYYVLFESAPQASDALTDDQLDALRDRMKEKISGRLHPAAKPLYRSIYFRVAAAVAVLLGTIWLVPTLFRADQKTGDTVAIARAAEDVPVNRFLTLPDGSTVILHGDSRIELDGNFNRSARIVRLTGEAYFDVARRDNVPFIIYTGKIKTTVLGTAFNISAWPGKEDITVSVTRGKVRVEDENRVLAVLAPDEQVTYHTGSATSDERQVEAAESIAWLQRDMTFEDMSLGELAHYLGMRYGVGITFGNPDLRECRVTGRFSGTETLEEAMRTLSILMDTRYIISGAEVLIEGEKMCN